MKFVRILGVLAVVAAIAAAAAYSWATRYDEIAAIQPVSPSSFDSNLVDRGEQLSALGDCDVCHTRPGGERLAGGLELPTPFGIIRTTNITPDPDTGIGRWSEAAFLRAMHEGVDRGGNHLYPAFPYDHFTRVTPEDIGAIYAYLMSQPAVKYHPPQSELRFPFGFRPLLAGWKLLFLNRGVYETDPEQNEEWNRGAYLVLGLGHCGACHTPRNALGALKRNAHLAGGDAEDWDIPPLGGASIAPIAWTTNSIANYLFDGWDKHHGIAAGPMTPVVNHLYDQPEDDVFAMAAYLTSFENSGARGPDTEAVVADAARLDWGSDVRLGGSDSPSDPALRRGEKLFFDQCVDCHKAVVSPSQPVSLALTFTMNAPTARNIVHIIFDGIRPPVGAVQRSMPALARTVSDEELIDLLAYARWRFTDGPPWSDLPETVAAARARGAN